MNRDSLSDIELFFTESVTESHFVLTDDEAKHASKVLRKKQGDIIYATDGNGKILKGEIEGIDKRNVFCSILETMFDKPEFPKIKFYIPNLHNKDRMRFALEKLIELGFTDITIFSSSRTVAKGFNEDKWRKVGIAAIKQSLRAVLPEIKYLASINKFLKTENENVILLDQHGDISAKEFINSLDKNGDYSIFIGPEGNLSDSEIELLSPDFKVKLGTYRLRSETAIFTIAALIKGCY